MIVGTTISGVDYEIDEKVLDNMELVDSLSEASNDNPLAISQVCNFILGVDLKKKLYDSVRIDGRVPVEKLTENLMDILAAFGKKGKN